MEGPFISCSSLAVLQLGQRVPAIVPLDVPQPEESPQPVWPGHKRRRVGGEFAGQQDDGAAVAEEVPQPKPGKGSGSGPTLGDIIAAGILMPGHDSLSVTYKGVKYLASLMDDGAIIFQDKRFNSPSAFSVHVKRLQTPNKQGDDGWKSVFVGGMALDEYRKRYRQMRMDPALQAAQVPQLHGQHPEEQQQRQQQRQQQQQQQQQGYAPPAARPPKQKARKKATPAKPVIVVPQQQYVQAQPQLETAHWVQCGRCETWRIVPDEHWLTVEADPRDDWFCEDAFWDVAAYEPYAIPCRGRG